MKNAFLLSSFLTLACVSATATAAQSEKKASTAAELLVDINAAGVTELAKLPGIGEQVAKRIVAYREENGPFEKAEELLNVRGIGEKSFLKLQSRITVGPEKDKRKK